MQKLCDNAFIKQLWKLDTYFEMYFSTYIKMYNCSVSFENKNIFCPCTKKKNKKKLSSYQEHV